LIQETEQVIKEKQQVIKETEEVIKETEEAPAHALPAWFERELQLAIESTALYQLSERRMRRQQLQL